MPLKCKNCGNIITCNCQLRTYKTANDSCSACIASLIKQSSVKKDDTKLTPEQEAKLRNGK